MRSNTWPLNNGPLIQDTMAKYAEYREANCEHIHSVLSSGHSINLDQREFDEYLNWYRRKFAKPL